MCARDRDVPSSVLVLHTLPPKTAPVKRMADRPFTRRTLPTRSARGQTTGRARRAHAYPCTRPTRPAACAHALSFAHFQHTATHVHISASWAHKACDHFSQHSQHNARAAVKNVCADRTAFFPSDLFNAPRRGPTALRASLLPRHPHYVRTPVV